MHRADLTTSSPTDKQCGDWSRSGRLSRAQDPASTGRTPVPLGPSRDDNAPVSGTAEAFAHPFVLASTKVVPDTFGPSREAILNGTPVPLSPCGRGVRGEGAVAPRAMSSLAFVARRPKTVPGTVSAISVLFSSQRSKRFLAPFSRPGSSARSYLTAATANRVV
jgi:hypothetical protein